MWSFLPRGCDRPPGDRPASSPAHLRRREHDRHLSLTVAIVMGGHNQLVVLVGESSSGKTRACWEAVRTLPPDWRI